MTAADYRDPDLPEVWVPAYKFESTHEVSNLGRVRSWIDRGRRRRPAAVVLTGSINRQGYRVVGFARGHLDAVHRIVMASFHGPTPSGLEICHINGVQTDNRLNNLRFDTPAANHADKVLHGTNFRLLTNDQVRRIRAEYVPGRHSGDRGNAWLLAQELGITRRHVVQIANGRRGKNLP